MLRLIRLISALVLAMTLAVILYAAMRPAQALEAFSISTDDGLALTLSEDGQVVGLTMDGEPLPITPGPILWVRDMSAAGQVSEPNLLTNPGFEDGEIGWQMGLQVGTDIALTDTVSHSGDWSLLMQGTYTHTLGRATVMAEPVVVTPGQRYRLSAYFLSSRGYVLGLDGTPPKRQDQVWRGLAWPNGIYLSWLDGDGQLLDDLVLVAPLHWEANSWCKVSGEVRAPPDAAQLELTIGGRLQDEYLWVDDLSIIASSEMEQPVTGTVAQQDNQLIQTATITTGLTLTATYTPEADHIAVDVEMQDTAEVDRALEVIVALPVDADGWHWWDDVHHSRLITVGSVVASLPPEYPLPSCLSWTYEHVVSSVWDGWLPISLYPYALMEDGTHGLALATSLDSPRLAKLAYDQEQERYEARGYLGISPLATKLDGQADLSLELYRVDPTWGFRGAVDCFAARHSTWFESPRPMYNYNGYDRAYYMSEEGAQQVLAYDAEGIFAAQYIVAEAPLKDGPVSEPLPTYEETIELVEELSASSQAGNRAKAEAITSSVACSPNGDWMIKHVGEYNWAPGVWEICWQTSTDPDIEGGWGEFTWDWAINPSIEATEAISAVLDGVMMDNFTSATGVDTHPDHLALTDTPLTYQVSTYQPGVHNAANVHEFFLWLRDTLDAQGRNDMAITINFWGLATPNGLAHYIDAFGGEGGSKTQAHSNWNPRILDYRRAIAYHKPQAWANGEPNLTLDDVEQFVDLALFYGIFPTRKDEATGWEPGSDQLITDTHQVLFQFWAAGWEPVTHAWTDSEDVWVERFGNGFQVDNPKPETQNPELFFTVHNTLTETTPFTLTVDAAAVGITEPARLTVTELVSGDAVPYEVQGDLLLIRGELTPLDTLVFRLQDSMPHRLYLPLLMKAWFGEPTLITDIMFAVVEGESLALDACLPAMPGPHPAVILVHGGYWQTGDKESHSRLGEWMAEHGYATFAINYRLAPEFPFPAAVADVQCAIAWVRAHAHEYDVDPDRLALMGTSAGGHLAAVAGLAAAPSAPSAPWQPSCGDPEADVGVQAVISCFGPVDLAFHAQESEGAGNIVAVFLGQACKDAPQLCAAASPMSYVTADAPPTLLIHGTDDDVVSCENSTRLYAALDGIGADVTYLPIEGAQHGFILGVQSPEAQMALNAVEDFLPIMSSEF